MPRKWEKRVRAATRIASCRQRYVQTVAGMFEPLENRRLMTVDLTGTFVSAPTSAFSGTKQAVTVNVTNSGSTNAKGSMTVAFYATVDGDTFNPNTDLLLGQLTKSINIVGGGSLNINYSLPVSASLIAGNYRINAVFDSALKIAETDENNNTAQSPALSVAQPNYDLVPTYDPKTTVLPAVVAGLKTNGSVRVIITNASGATATLPSGQSVLVEVVARPVGAPNDTQDVVLNRSVVKAGIGSLAPGKSKTFTVNIQFPDTLANGSYDIVAKLDTGDALSETDENNNEVAFSHDVDVAGQFSDPTLVFNSGTIIPPGVVADGRKMPLKFDVSNLGNTKIPGGQTCSISIYAHNISSNTDTPIQTFAVSLTGLGSGGNKTLNLTPTIPLNLANGEFELRAALSTTCSGDVIGNNSNSCVTHLNVGPAFYNLSVQTPTTNFPPAVVLGTQVPGTVSIGVKNLSNAIIPAGTVATVTVVLRPVGDLTTLNDILIGTTTNTALSNLGIGSTKTLNVSCKIPATLPNLDPVPEDDYQIIVTVTPAALAESSLSDNTATGPTVTIAPQFVDLAIVSAGQNFRLPTPDGTSGIGTVVLRNMGNVTVQGGVTVQFWAKPLNSVISYPIGSHTFPVFLRPGQSTFTLSSALILTIPGNANLATQVDISARIDPSPLTDVNPGNNELGAGIAVISSQYVDLKFSNVSNPFSGTMTGNDTGSAHLQINNIGNGLASGVVTVSYYASLTSSLDGNEILLGSQTASISLGVAQISASIPVILTLPDPLTTTTYKILAKIIAPLTLDNNPNNNLSPVLGTVTVDPLI